MPRRFLLGLTLLCLVGGYAAWLRFRTSDERRLAEVIEQLADDATRRDGGLAMIKKKRRVCCVA